MSIIISGSGVRTGNSTTKVLEFGTEGTMTLNGDLTTTGSAGFTTITATGLASLDGGINVDDNFTVSAAGAVVAVGVNAGGAISGATTIDGSGDLTMGTITMTGFSVDADGDVQVKTLDVNSGGITEAGAIAGATTINASGRITGGSFTDGTATLSGGRFAALSDLTASYAKIGVLDVETINSKTTTVENVEVSASLMILSDGAESALEANGSGLWLSGANAFFGWNNSKSALSSSHQMFVNGNMELGSGASLVIGNAEMSEADLEKLDGITAGTALASKALVVDSNKDIGTIRHLTSNGTLTGASGSLGATGVTTLAATGLASLDGGINVEDAFTVSTAGAVVAASLNNSSGGITNAGSIAGATTISGSGLLSMSHIDLDGDLDVNGTANLDAVDIDGAVQIDNTLSVGVNGTGYDVKLYGDTAGAYLMWDESSNSLNMINAHMSGTTATFLGAVMDGDDATNKVGIKVAEQYSVKAGQFVTYSDATLKKNVKQLDGAIEKVMSMRGVSYEMKNDTQNKLEVGFIAQEMKQQVPEVVYGDGDGNYGIDYGKLTSVLVEAVKAQQTQIDELKALLKK